MASFLKKVFKAKKGGTFVGNLIRGAANKVSGGILGNGVMRDQRDAKAEAKEAKKALAGNLGATIKNNANASPRSLIEQVQQAEQGIEPQEENAKSWGLNLGINSNTGEQVQKAGNSMILVIVAIALVVLLLFKRK